jgi:TM2 domain-containing membrane protein YozV
MRTRAVTTYGESNTHGILIGYLLWIFGFMGSHRFYYGRPVTGTLWFFTLGLFFVGWILDLLLIPGMDRAADRRYIDGPVDYNLAWVLLTFLGIFGIHRFYLGKWLSGLLWLVTGGLFLVGIVYDYWTLNGQIDAVNAEAWRPQRVDRRRRISAYGRSAARAR